MKEKAKRPGKRVGRREKESTNGPSYRNVSDILIGLSLPFLQGWQCLSYRNDSACPIGMAEF
jgi:hypothetical protein